MVWLREQFGNRAREPRQDVGKLQCRIDVSGAFQYLAIAICPGQLDTDLAQNT